MFISEKDRSLKWQFFKHLEIMIKQVIIHDS
jgi:hypothetical protein